MSDVKVRSASDIVATLRYRALTGVRVCFINMPLREAARPNTPPQGPGLMAARLLQYGAEASIIDLNAYRIVDEEAEKLGLPNGRHLSHEEALRLIEAHFERHGEPHLVGISGKITTLRWQEWTVETLRYLVPDAFLISGGGLATQYKRGLLERIPGLDAVGHSEGDDIIVLAASDVKRFRGDRERMAGAASNERHGQYVGEIAGRHRFIYHGSRPRDLDALPFSAWHLLERDVYGNPVLEWYIETPVWGDLRTGNSSAAPFTMKRSLTTVSSRGCPHACTFCFRGAQGERNWGLRSSQNLRAEIEWLKRTYGVDFVGFPDDNFAISVERCLELPAAFDGLDIKWGTHFRLDECDPLRLGAMSRAGLVYVGVGAESASKNVLYAMDKGGHIVRKGGVERLTEWQGYEFPTTMIDGIRTCREVGVHVNCTWIMGFPTETLRDLQTSVAFIMWQIEECKKYDISAEAINKRLFTATWYPGTTMVEASYESVPKGREYLAVSAEKARGLLNSHFGITFEKAGTGRSTRYAPIIDEAMWRYVLELDDATKVLHGTDGAPLNYSAMSDDVFLEARGYIDAGELDKVLAM
jgi:hypothetical protein